MTNTRRLSTIAILSALSFVLMYFDFPLLPAASFLRIEFSIFGSLGFTSGFRSTIPSVFVENPFEQSRS